MCCYVRTVVFSVHWESYRSEARKLHLLVNQGFPSSLIKLCFLLCDNFLHSEHAPLPQGDVKWYVQRHIMGPFTSSGKCNHDKSLEVHTVEAFANREDIAQRGGLLALPAPPAPALKGHVSLTVHWTLYGIHRSCVLQPSVSCTSGQTHTVYTVVYNGSLHDSCPPFLEDLPAPLSWPSINRTKILSPTFIFPNNEPQREGKASLVGSTSLIFAKISSPFESHYTCTGRTMKETWY